MCWTIFYYQDDQTLYWWRLSWSLWKGFGKYLSLLTSSDLDVSMTGLITPGFVYSKDQKALESEYTYFRYFCTFGLFWSLLQFMDTLTITGADMNFNKGKKLKIIRRVRSAFIRWCGFVLAVNFFMPRKIRSFNVRKVFSGHIT